MRRIKIGELCVCKKDVFQKPNQIVRVVKRQRTVVDKIKVIGDLEEDGYCKRVYHYADRGQVFVVPDELPDGFGLWIHTWDLRPLSPLELLARCV